MMFSLNWWKIKRNRDAILAIVAVAAPVLGGSWLVYEKFFDPSDPQPAKVEVGATVEVAGNNSGVIAAAASGGTAVVVTGGSTVNVGYTVEQFSQVLRERETAIRADLERAHTAEKALIFAQLDEVRRQLADPEQALATAREQIAELEVRLGNAGSADEQAAKDALEKGDLVTARVLFERVAAEKAPDVIQAADAAYALGRIAEIEVRWAVASRHYGDAARLVPSFANLLKAREFAWRTGEFAKALGAGGELVRAAISEFGEDSAEHATALNEHAITLKDTGRYAEAEPLYKQALAIDARTLGEEHPAYASGLNNLAGLLAATGRYAEAEPLYKQALAITAKTLGAEHPEYATRLNNLAGLLDATGRYAEAEPLYRQALAILEKVLGNDHPNAVTVRGNLDELLRNSISTEPQSQP